MNLTFKERKQYLEENKELIWQHCYQSTKEFFEPAFVLTDKDLQYETNSLYKSIKKIILHEKMFGHKEEVSGIDLKPYLNKIRYNDRESMMCLIIKDGKVLEEVTEQGLVSNCDWNNKTTLKAIKKAQKLKAGIYSVHNHPLQVSAKPSGYVKEDKKMICDTKYWRDTLPKFAKKYHVEILDFAVVSVFDYFSLEQSGWKDKPDEFFFVKKKPISKQEDKHIDSFLKRQLKIRRFKYVDAKVRKDYLVMHEKQIDKYYKEDSPTIKNKILRRKLAKDIEALQCINLKEYLELIRNDHHHSILCLFIKSMKVEKAIVTRRENDEDYIRKMMAKAKRMDADLYIAYNRPFEISALITRNDKEMKYYKTYKKIVDEYETTLLDVGIVTEYDYYSYIHEEFKKKPL